MNDAVLYEAADGIATITLNRPERLNAMNAALLQGALEALETAAADDGVRVVVMTGAGRGFCAGGDLSARDTLGTGPTQSRIRVLRTYMRSSQLLREMPKVTIAAVNGPCAGAGFSWACAADLRYAASSARFVTAFLNAGLSGDFGGTWTLPRIVGRARARELYLLSEAISAEQAEGIGLVTKAVPDAEFMPYVYSVARKLGRCRAGHAALHQAEPERRRPSLLLRRARRRSRAPRHLRHHRRRRRGRPRLPGEAPAGVQGKVAFAISPSPSNGEGAGAGEAPCCRMRQICLVASDLKKAEDDLTSIFGLAVCHRDPGVEAFGLHNFLLPIGNSFLEVVAPFREGTAAGRYLERRGGDGGYMVIMQTGDVMAARERVTGMGVRLVLDDVARGRSGSIGIQLHPRDVPGAIAELRWNQDDAAPDGPWGPAGPDWKAAQRTDVVRAMIAAEIQSDDPKALAERWSRVIDRPVSTDSDGNAQLSLDDAVLRFVEPPDGRGEGLGGLDLDIVDREHVMREAAKRGCPVRGGALMVCGVRFRLC